MINLKVVFNVDPTGFDKDITEEILIPSELCLYCLHDKQNRFHDEIVKALQYKGYEFKEFFQLLKVYSQ